MLLSTLSLIFKIYGGTPISEEVKAILAPMRAKNRKEKSNGQCCSSSVAQSLKSLLDSEAKANKFEPNQKKRQLLIDVLRQMKSILSNTVLSTLRLCENVLCELSGEYRQAMFTHFDKGEHECDTFLTQVIETIPRTQFFISILKAEDWQPFLKKYEKVAKNAFFFNKSTIERTLSKTQLNNPDIPQIVFTTTGQKIPHGHRDPKRINRYSRCDKALGNLTTSPHKPALQNPSVEKKRKSTPTPATPTSSKKQCTQTGSSSFKASTPSHTAPFKNPNQTNEALTQLRIASTKPSYEEKEKDTISPTLPKQDITFFAEQTKKNSSNTNTSDEQNSTPEILSFPLVIS